MREPGSVNTTFLNAFAIVVFPSYSILSAVIVLSLLLSNFILGVCFVLPAGLIYKRKKTQKSAMIGALAGAVLMSVVSVFSNYFVVYPVYTNFMPMQAILGAYQAINKNVKTLWDALIWFNMPFTFIKGMCSVVITFFIYKKISPILKGTSR